MDYLLNIKQLTPEELKGAILNLIINGLPSKLSI